MLQPFRAEDRRERARLVIIPHPHQVPGEGAREFKEEPVGILPGALHLLAGQAVSGRLGEHLAEQS